MFKAKLPTAARGSVRYVLLRVYGNKTELILNRDKEIEVCLWFVLYLSGLQNIKRLRIGGCGPVLYGTFVNGYVYEFYEGRSLTGEGIVLIC